ncbi:MAG: SAM-dependent methyltransferase, partial [Proteobacteria bacterium]
MVALRPYESKAIRAVTGATIRPGGLELTRRTAAYCGLKAGDRVLDVGCGTGATVAFLNRQMGIRAIGVDVSAKLLAEARSKAPNLSVMRANGVALPVRSAAVGAVYCECVLSLISDTMAALVECRRV